MKILELKYEIAEMNNRIDGFKSRLHTAEKRISEMEIT